ncbi:MAG TPA: circularly permuted type 2 ATP-grasp protein [Polyangiaceae bacterium]|nr:circularly permuted type 2 ATP-grasp protein [Polyangiaceae bacterium]
MSFTNYSSPNCYDEMLTREGEPRASIRGVVDLLRRLELPELRARQSAAEATVRALGITFTVYSQGSNRDREWPFDIIPRVIVQSEWDRIARGLEQRVQALNQFIDDLYNQQRAVQEGVFPAELLASSKNYLPQCRGIQPKFGVWAHVCGSDLVRDRDGTVYVLEDNLRIPSGVSYMLENRALTKSVFPELFEEQRIQPVDGYPTRLYSLLQSLSPDDVSQPRIVLLTPGSYNSAYFEHCYLASQMGIELVRGTDLVVLADDCVYMKTIGGLERVHVIYRRVDDAFLDPEAFDPRSVLGVRGLMRAWRAGTVAIANAPGSGVADDKLVCTYVPDLIRFYLAEEPILQNVPTLRMLDESARKRVLERLEEFVVKPVNESGGYGIMVGSASTPAELAACREAVLRDPRNFVAQPIVSLSTAPTLCDAGVEPRHLDLRPFILSGETTYVTRGGLTRVALRKGSLVVNSSQGGGSKDTWIVAD